MVAQQEKKELWTNENIPRILAGAALHIYLHILCSFVRRYDELMVNTSNDLVRRNEAEIWKENFREFNTKMKSNVVNMNAFFADFQFVLTSSWTHVKFSYKMLNDFYSDARIFKKLQSVEPLRSTILNIFWF